MKDNSERRNDQKVLNECSETLMIHGASVFENNQETPDFYCLLIYKRYLLQATRSKYYLKATFGAQLRQCQQRLSLESK